MKGYGFAQAPVVEGAGDPWSGFRPDRIDELVRTRAVTTFPTSDEEYPRLAQKVGERDGQLQDYGQRGWFRNPFAR